MQSMTVAMGLKNGQMPLSMTAAVGLIPIAYVMDSGIFPLKTKHSQQSLVRFCSKIFSSPFLLFAVEDDAIDAIPVILCFFTQVSCHFVSF